ncbi:hypothetical protein FACS18949_02100 [Clostridia bacterium]|nr:hypothetical protein FACS18949_02100 [Clostridia bacterium]
MSEQIKIQKLNVSKLDTFLDHPFKIYTGNKFTALVDSVKESGVLSPIIVRPKGDRYEILSGHNRVAAAKEVGLTSVPAIVRTELTDDEAKIIVTVTNLVQRSFADLSHSERAAALTAHYTAIKSQGKRTDILESIGVLLGEPNEDATFATLQQKLTARDFIAQTYGIKASSVAQYLRINYLINGLKDKLDLGEFSVRAAVELSFLSEATQGRLMDLLDTGDSKVEASVASELRTAEIAADGELDTEEVKRILDDKKAITTKPKRAVKVGDDVLLRFFNAEQSDNEVEDTIAKALEAWFAERV